MAPRGGHEQYISAHVTPAGKRERVTQTGVHAYELVVREPARGNRANHRTRELIAAQYQISPSAVRLVAGHRSQKKVLTVTLPV